MKHLLAGSLVAASLVSLATSAAIAKDKPAPASPLVAAIDRCRQITDPTQRLACFDGAANALVKATASGDVSVVDRGEVRKVRHSLFGFSLPKVPFFAGDTTAGEAQDKLDTTIKSVRQLPSGHYQIVVTDNNAIWETSESGGVTFEPPHAGQKIEILRGALGNYFLRIDGQVGVRGKRIG